MSMTWFLSKGVEKPRYSGLTSAEEIMARQRDSDSKMDASVRRSSMAGLTLRVAMQDVREVLVGIPHDLYEGDASFPGVLVKNDRLRGLGVLLLALCLAYIVSW